MQTPPTRYSRGHWEGDTLVVETANFNGKRWVGTAMAAGRLRGLPFTEQLRITERLHASR